MQDGWQNWCGQARTRQYKTGGGLLTALGVAMIAAGLLLLFLCIPGWFWAALAGGVLIVAGWLLVTLGHGR